MNADDIARPGAATKRGRSKITSTITIRNRIRIRIRSKSRNDSVVKKLAAETSFCKCVLRIREGLASRVAARTPTVLEEGWAEHTLQLVAEEAGEEVDFGGGEERFFGGGGGAGLAEGGHAVVGFGVKGFVLGVGDEASEPVFGAPAGQVRGGA